MNGLVVNSLNLKFKKLGTLSGTSNTFAVTEFTASQLIGITIQDGNNFYMGNDYRVTTVNMTGSGNLNISLSNTNFDGASVYAYYWA